MCSVAVATTLMLALISLALDAVAVARSLRLLARDSICCASSESSPAAVCECVALSPISRIKAFDILPGLKAEDSWRS